MEKKVQIWYRVKVKVERGFEEAVEFAFNELDSLGNEIDNLGIKKSEEDITVSGYFEIPPDANQILETLSKAFNIYNFPPDSIKNVTTEEVEDQDWLAEWKKHWKPTETNKFIIAPPWENVENSSKIIIQIEPNMAFGTGTHETTRLCLKAIEEHYRPEMSFFDVGTGTGILSIAVSKLRSTGYQVLSTEKEEPQHTPPRNSALSTQYSVLSTPITACDIDEDSVKIAIENARLNDAKEIEFFIGSISEESPKFDFICANVTADIIMPMLPLLVEKSKKFLLLSGILVEQKDLIVNKLKDLGIENAEIETDGEWISLRAGIN